MGLKTSYSAGKDIFWYAKEKQDNGDAVQEELNMVKAREEELMLEVNSCTSSTVHLTERRTHVSRACITSAARS